MSLPSISKRRNLTNRITSLPVQNHARATYPSSGFTLCLLFHLRYSSTKLSGRKRIVILLGEEIIASQQSHSLTVLESVFNTISAKDQFNVVIFSSQPHTTVRKGGHIDCTSTQLVAGTRENKNSILNWLKATQWATPTESNYAAAFEEAFTSLNLSTPEEIDQNIILFVSSVAQDDDPQRVFEIFNRYKDLSAVIHTYGLEDSIDDVLLAIAQQDGTILGLSASASRNEGAIAGRSANVEDLDELR